MSFEDMFDREPTDKEMELQYEVEDLEEDIKQIQSELDRFKLAYNIYMDYFDYLDEDSKREIDEKLNEIGL